MDNLFYYYNPRVIDSINLWSFKITKHGYFGVKIVKVLVRKQPTTISMVKKIDEEEASRKKALIWE